MGYYTELEFSGTVKEEYRDAIDRVICYDNSNDKDVGSVYDTARKWLASGIDFMMDFAKVPRAMFIPNGIPDGTNHIWDKRTGKWEFETKLKDYENTYDAFFNIAVLFMDSINKCRLHGEDCSDYIEYHVVNGKMRLVKEKGVDSGKQQC